MADPRHFLTGEELAPDEIGRLLDRALELKAGRESRRGSDALAGKTVALFFERPSTRTRVSFQVGVVELGAHPLALRADELQLGRGESIVDNRIGWTVRQNVFIERCAGDFWRSPLKSLAA